jgi:hypothetical protein
MIPIFETMHSTERKTLIEQMILFMKKSKSIRVVQQPCLRLDMIPLAPGAPCHSGGQTGDFLRIGIF